MHNREISELLTDELSLRIPPVALRRTDHPPPGVPREELQPSACTFWRKAESGVFFADADSHFGCPIGAMVMGFDLSEPVSDDLMRVVSAMGSCGYIDKGEPPLIPTFPQGHAGILYGPLAQFPGDPEVVLMWLAPSQAMLYAEAAGVVRWTGRAPAATFGRPACAALAAALSGDDVALSLGCIGMRTFTEISSDQLLAAVPGDRLEQLADSVLMTVKANAAMRSAYQERKARLTPQS